MNGLAPAPLFPSLVAAAIAVAATPMQFPPVEMGLMDGDLAFRQHSTGHTDGPNWPTFIAFAGRYFR